MTELTPGSVMAADVEVPDRSLELYLPLAAYEIGDLDADGFAEFATVSTINTMNIYRGGSLAALGTHGSSESTWSTPPLLEVYDVIPGDYDGDALDDLLLVANGEAYYWSATDLPTSGILDPATATTQVTNLGPQNLNDVGRVSAGDLNGDGKDEFPVRNPYSTLGGSASNVYYAYPYAVFGSRATWFVAGADLELGGTLDAQFDAAMTIVGLPGWNLGTSVAIGDLTGDGVGDAMIGYNGFFGPYTPWGAGGVWVEYGRP